MADIRPSAGSRRLEEKKRSRQSVLRPTKSKTALNRAKRIEDVFEEYEEVPDDICINILHVVLSGITSERNKKFSQTAGLSSANTPGVIGYLDVRPQTPPQPPQPETPSNTNKFGSQSKQASVGSPALEQKPLSIFMARMKPLEYQESLQIARTTSPEDLSTKVTKRKGYRGKPMQTTRTPPKKSRGSGSQRGCSRCREAGHYISTCRPKGT